MDNSATTIIIIVAGVTIFSAVVNLLTTTIMFAKLANTIARILEQTLIVKNEVKEVEVNNE